MPVTFLKVILKLVCTILFKTEVSLGHVITFRSRSTSKTKAKTDIILRLGLLIRSLGLDLDVSL